MNGRLNRRHLLQTGAAAVAASLLPEAVIAQVDRLPQRGTRSLRIAHLTDSHVQPERGADEGLRACIRHAVANHAPDLFLAGGDQIMDALAKPRDRVKLQFELWNQIIRDECPVPVLHVIGNHDIWGWADPKKSQTTGDEPEYGKAWALDAFRLDRRYYSVDRGGWHLIILDSTQYDGGAYVAQIDEEQFEWLENDLKSTPTTTPIVIASHIPIISFCPLMFSTAGPTTAPFPKPRWSISRALLHIDARKLKDLFVRHPNIKLCLSGHIHLADRVDYLGITYLCNPAVSGGWWGGPFQEVANGYTVVDLFPDGSFAHQWVDYGWIAR